MSEPGVGSMYRLGLTISFILLLVACDPVVNATLRLPPAPAIADSITAQGNAMRSDPVAAIDRFALAYGLQREAQFPKACTREWRGGPFRTPGSRGRDLWLDICANVLPEGGLNVRLSEYITNYWSPRGDSLRRALADP